MYARNFRRREVSQRKKDGTGHSPGGDHKDQKPEFLTANSNQSLKQTSYVHPSSPNSNSAQSNIANNNASDFCNELLTAASIIESQNCTSTPGNFQSPKENLFKC